MVRLHSALLTSHLEPALDLAPANRDLTVAMARLSHKPQPRRWITRVLKRSRLFDTEHCGALAALALLCVLACFVMLQLLVPLSTAIKIGEDEDFELSKATLALKGYHFYTEIWNDQPLFHTALVTGLLKHVSGSVLMARLLTSAYSLLLLGAFFCLSTHIGGLAVGTLSALLLLVSPGFLELGSSCMVEIPALAPAIAGLCVILTMKPARIPRLAEIMAGVCFAIACQTKFISIVLLPVAGLILLFFRDYHHERRSGDGDASVSMRDAGSFLNPVVAMSVFSAAFLIAFLSLQVVLSEGDWWLEFQQSWSAHFGGPKTLEYGSPDQFPFQWAVLLKHWDATIPALFGIFHALRQVKSDRLLLLPVVWLALALMVFGTHKPWWPYYYIHTAVPLCCCASVGIVWLSQEITRRDFTGLKWSSAAVGVAASMWIAGRMYFQITGIRHMPQIYSSLALTEIARYKPFVKFLYTDEPSYSFHAGIPLPPRLAVSGLKRYWSGSLTHAIVGSEMSAIKPELILLANDAAAMPFQDLLNLEYHMVYQDRHHKLYAIRSIISKAKW